MNPAPFSLSPGQGVKIAAKFVGFMVALYIVIGIALFVWSALHHLPKASRPDLGPAGTIVVNTLACFLLLRGELRRSQIPWRALGAWRIAPVTLLAPFFLMVVGAAILVSEIDDGLRSVLPPPARLIALFSQLHDLAAHPIVGPLALVVMAPVTEELLCRGLILRGLLAKISSWRAILLSSLLFALIHLSPWQFPIAFVSGLVFGWVYFRTGSLSLCMAGHALINALSLLAPGLPFVIRGFNTAPLTGTVDFQPWWFDLLGVALIVCGILWFRRWAPPLAKPAGAPPPSVPVSADPVV
jgi:uncharacterized protein